MAKKQDRDATVMKFPLHVTEVQTVRMPKGALVLSAGAIQEHLYVWAEVVDSADVEDRVFGVYHTGHKLPPGHGSFVGTVVLQSGNQVYHVYVK